jgi:hypothetical protein
MKRTLLVILALCFITPLFAGTVGDIDAQAWMQHTNEMQGLRKGILSLITKENRTPQDSKRLELLTQTFEAKHLAWENYLKDVAENGKAAVPPTATRAYKDGYKGKVYTHKKLGNVKVARYGHDCSKAKAYKVKKACDGHKIVKKACGKQNACKKQAMKKGCENHGKKCDGNCENCKNHGKKCDGNCENCKNHGKKCDGNCENCKNHGKKCDGNCENCKNHGAKKACGKQVMKKACDNHKGAKIACKKQVVKKACGKQNTCKKQVMKKGCEHGKNHGKNCEGNCENCQKHNAKKDCGKKC